jgi:hypothetical protein
MSIRLSEGYSIQPLLTPADIVADDPAGTSYLDLNMAHWVTLVTSFGAITCDSVTVTLEASTAGSSNATETAIGFNYRLSTAVDTMDSNRGSITAATSTGVAVTASDDHKVLLIEVDPSAVAALGADFKFIRLSYEQGDATAAVVGCIAFIEPRYAGNATISST